MNFQCQFLSIDYAGLAMTEWYIIHVFASGVIWGQPGLFWGCTVTPNIFVFSFFFEKKVVLVLGFRPCQVSGISGFPYSNLDSFRRTLHLYIDMN